MAKRGSKRAKRKKGGRLIRQRLGIIEQSLKANSLAMLTSKRTPSSYFGEQVDKINRQVVQSDRIAETTRIHQRFIENALVDQRIRKVCNNRRKRRQIMFSKGKAGAGKRVSKNRRITEDSKVRC
jgi:hypothetical protein